MPQEWLLFIGILFKSVPVVLAGALGVMLFSRSQLGKALIRRLQEEPRDAEVIAALQADVEELRQELGDIQERLDFAEHRLVRPGYSSVPSRSEDPSPPEPVTAQRR